MNQTRDPVRPPIVITIAGSDPSGGAGIQADLATCSALGVLGMSALTALTVQSPKGLRSVHALAPELVLAQLDGLLEDLPTGSVRAFKLGMLGTAEIVRAVAERLGRGDVAALPVVVDPVLRATRGSDSRPGLLEADGLEAMQRHLLPRTDVLTPNLDEAAALLGRSVGEVLTAPESACRDLAELGPRAVVLKGGHMGGFTSEDLVYCDGEVTRLSAERVATSNDHGTGCVFASALAAELALGRDLSSAARAAKEFVTRALVGAREWDFGGGSGPLDLAAR